MRNHVKSHTELEVYKKAFNLAMNILESSKKFPKEETYSPVDQIRRSSRSVCANLAEAWRKRRYEVAFIRTSFKTGWWQVFALACKCGNVAHRGFETTSSKLSDAETEAAETQVWLEFSVKCGYLNRESATQFYKLYDEVIATIVGMINHSNTWILPK